MGVCGSCGMMVNGRPELTCASFLVEYAPGPIRVAPLDHFGILRDLVVNTGGFLEKLESVRPWLITDQIKPLIEGEYNQTPEQKAEYDQYSMCINCMLCYSSCPVVGLEPEFVGPAAIALAQRYNLDSRDDGEKQRKEVLTSERGVYSCTLVGECSEVCPKAEAWEALLAWLATPASIILHLILLIGLLFHSFTWFWIAPMATVLRIRGKKVPDRVIIAGNLIVWVLLSLAVAWFVLNA